MNMLEGKLQMTVYHSETILHKRHKGRSKCVGRGGVGGIGGIVSSHVYHMKTHNIKG